MAPVLAASVFTFGVSAGFSGLVFVVSALIVIVTVPMVLNLRKTYKEQ